MTAEYGSPDNDPPTEEFLPRITDDDGIRDETVLEDKVNPPWLDNIFKVTGQIVAASIVVGLTSGILIVCLGSIWWLLSLFF